MVFYYLYHELTACIYAALTKCRSLHHFYFPRFFVDFSLLYNYLLSLAEEFFLVDEHISSYIKNEFCFAHSLLNFDKMQNLPRPFCRIISYTYFCYFISHNIVSIVRSTDCTKVLSAAWSFDNLKERHLVPKAWERSLRRRDFGLCCAPPSS